MTKCQAGFATASESYAIVGNYTAKNVRASCNTSVDIVSQLVTTSRYQDAFAWLATACDNKSVASCQQTCCKLLTDLLQVDYFSRPVAISESCNNLQMTSCNKPDLNRLAATC